MEHRRKPWRKNLYENREYEDNYTDASFLKDMRRNYNLQLYTPAECLVGACNVSQEISVVVLFLVVFFRLYENSVQPQRLLLDSFTATGVGYAAHIGGDIARAKNVVEDSKTVLVVLLFGYLFSPLLHTLTDSISTDTIFSTTCAGLCLHLLTHDYGLSDGFLVSRTISLNCGIFAAICLASRLSTPFHAFVLLVVAAEVFVLKPLLFERIFRPAMLAPIAALTAYCLLSISRLLLVLYVATILFVNVACPLIFQRLHARNKSIIHGPWDEALIESDGQGGGGDKEEEKEEEEEKETKTARRRKTE